MSLMHDVTSVTIVRLVGFSCNSGTVATEISSGCQTY